MCPFNHTSIHAHRPHRPPEKQVPEIDSVITSLHLTFPRSLRQQPYNVRKYFWPYLANSRHYKSSVIIVWNLAYPHHSSNTSWNTIFQQVTIPKASPSVCSCSSSSTLRLRLNIAGSSWTAHWAMPCGISSFLLPLSQPLHLFWAS